MPPLPISLTIQAAVPWLSASGRSVISVLVAANGQIRNADTMAARLRMRGRFRLARLLRREGLPPFGQLADWVCVLQIVWEAEATKRPLHSFARRVGIDPATCYRRCKRLLGVPWRVARANGFAWALLAFMRRCHRPVDSARTLRATRSVGASPRAAVLQSPPTTPIARSPTIGARRSKDPLPPLQRADRVILGEAPTDAVVTASGAVFVCRAFAATVERLALPTLRHVASIPVGCNPTRIALDPSGQRVFVSNQFSCSITVIDTVANQVVDEIAVPGEPSPVLLAADRHTLYVTTNLDRLYALDVRRRQVKAEAILPAASHHMVLHPDRLRLFVAARAAGVVLEFDAQSLRLSRSVAVGGMAQALALEPRSAELYVTNEAGWMDVVKLEGFSPVASLRLGASGYGVSLSADAAWLYLTLPNIGRVAVVNRHTLRLVHSIDVGGSPRHTVVGHDQTVLVVNEAGWVDILR